MNNSNIAPMLNDLNSQLRELGRDSVASALAKPRMAVAITRAAADGIIGESDAAATYEQYLQGRQYAIGRNTMAQGDEDKGSVKANTSKNLQLIKLGLLPKVDGPALLDRVTDLRTAAIGGDVKIKPTFDCYVDAARAQLAQPTEELTDEQVNQLIRKPEPKNKDIIDKLIEDYKRLSKRYEELPSPGVEAAIHGIADAIKEAGGELPPLTKEEKKAAEAIAYLRSVGKLAA